MVSPEGGGKVSVQRNEDWTLHNQTSVVYFPITMISAVTKESFCLKLPTVCQSWTGRHKDVMCKTSSPNRGQNSE